MEEGIEQRIKKILESQTLAVLATHDRGAPYAHLIAFAAAADIRKIYFATSRLTRNYANLQAESRVALLIDNRENSKGEVPQAAALTALGRAAEVTGLERSEGEALFLVTHRDLRDFLLLPATALIQVTVEQYILVTRLQEVMRLYLNKQEPLIAATTL